MISKIELRNFKCFQSLELPIGQMTLLSGTNASGKSSILQSLVLLHQTIKEHEWSKRLMLNGSDICLGTVSDVVDKVYGRDSFAIGITDSETKYAWEFQGERAHMSLSVAQVLLGEHTHPLPEVLHYLLPHNPNIKLPPLAFKLRELTYITAERIGPRELYALEDSSAVTVVGPKGEHAASVLHLNREKPVLQSLLVPNTPENLLHQTEARMHQFFPGCSISVQQIAQANAVILGIRTANDTDFHRPVHVGFGLTQVFPIIVASLSAKKGDILLIENPEVHLHPAGQAQMGHFLAEAAEAGVQIIIESHSDHILNGIRRAVKSKKAKSESIKIHFFQPRSQEHSQVASPQIDAEGRIDYWPSGFFDQFDRDMNYFAGWDI